MKQASNKKPRVTRSKAITLGGNIGRRQFNFTFREGWVDMRDLGAVLDHEGPLAASCERSGAVELQDHQRSVVMRRRCASQVRGHHEAALGRCAMAYAHMKEAAN